MSILKTHIALNVSHLEKSVEFYTALFGINPVKYKPDYAKFDVAHPPLNLTLNLVENIQPGGTLSHLGIQVESSEAVQAAIQRFTEAKLATFEEKDTDCCYALQDKVWVTDPDGNRWEVFVVKLADTTPEDNLVKYSCC
jgi:catechol 2,3-dioxygenase-like lactoylglutathione lyase family enzyme